jgi:hypothetical protein
MNGISEFGGRELFKVLISARSMSGKIASLEELSRP